MVGYPYIEANLKPVLVTGYVIIRFAPHKQIKSVITASKKKSMIYLLIWC